MLRHHLSGPEWLVTESEFDPARANVFETLFSVGNGYLGTRGTLEEGHRGELSGTYLCGVYDRHDAPVIDLVNCPDWLAFAVHVDGLRLDVHSCTVLEHERALDLKQGLLWRRTVFADRAGRRTQLESLRFASLHDRHLCALRVEVTPLDHHAPITVRSALDGRRRNLDRLPVYADGSVFPAEVRWEKWAWSKHLREIGSSAPGDSIYLQTQTIDSGITLGYAAAVVASQPPEKRSVAQEYERIEKHADFLVAEGDTLVVDKFVTIYTSRDTDDQRGTALDSLARHRDHGFEECLADSARDWAALWQECDCRVDGDDVATHALRFSVYQLLIAANPDDPRVNIGAKSMTGEGYRGHVFWDTEVLMLPFFVYTQPETARSLLQYRHHTLPGAREVARDSGVRGARYPWEAADTGREECPMWTNDGAHRFWTRDEEIHVSADVAYGIMTYLEATGDTGFLLTGGAEIMFETSRFWVDRVSADGGSGTYSLKQVMGPDEFHSHVDDNAFTNRLAQWSLERAAETYELLHREHPDALAELADRIGLGADEPDRWREVAAGMAYEPDPPGGVIEQFAGYFDRLDVPITEWDENDMPRYPAGYHHFNCEDTMLLKQPDVVMLMHMLPEEFSPEVKRANFEFYEARTLHKSSLSPAIHAIMGIDVGDASHALRYFYRSALVDLADNQGNTCDGVHIASAGGTWQILVYGFGGFQVRGGLPTFTPWLPEQWKAIHFRLRWHGQVIDVAIGQYEAVFCLESPAPAEQMIVVRGETVTLVAGQPHTARLAETPAVAGSV